MSRRTARETALQALYEMEFHPGREQKIERVRGEGITGVDYTFYSQIIQGVREHQEMIDTVIQRFLKKGWTLSRISSVDRAILRISVYELLFEKETPRGAVLNEAVDIAKVFSSEESSRFINGVLGQVVAQLDQIHAELTPNS